MPSSKDFSFLLFSDLHSHKDKGFDLTHALSCMWAFLKEKNFNCDYIFITGDVANQCVYTDTDEIINNLRDSISLNKDGKQRIFWAVGNHDIKRGKVDREKIIHKIRASDNSSEAFEKEMSNDKSRKILTQCGMAEYLENYESVCGFKFPENDILDTHCYFELDEMNLFVINTCLTSFDDKDFHNLYFSTSQLITFFDKARPGLPTIAIGHHGKEFFNHTEEEHLRDLFKKRVDFYLCGHSHKPGYSSFDFEPEIHQITCGCSGKIENGTKLSFIYGEYLKDTNRLTITPYSYEYNGNKKWDEDYRLHDKLNQDNNTFELTRLGRGSGGGVVGKERSGSGVAGAADGAGYVRGVGNGDHPGAGAPPLLGGEWGGGFGSAARGWLFGKSKAFYDRQMSLGGRFSYVKHDDLLLTGILPFETKAILVRERNDGDNVGGENKNSGGDKNSGGGGDGEIDTASQARNVVECVFESDKHVLFIGEGGMGKTMSLLRVWQNELESTDDDKKLPLYVPLNEYNIAGEWKFIYEFIKDKYDFDLVIAAERTKIILLLDGFNEITRDNSPIVSEIKDYMNRENIQIALTSRYDFRTAHGFFALRAYHLQPLDETIVNNYLAQAGIPYDNEMLEVLKNPMMLTLFANTSARQKEIEERFKGQFDFKQNRTVAEILHNYMICEVGKLAITNEQDRIMATAVALWHIAPYIAYELESQGRFTMPKKDLNKYIMEFIKAYGEEAYKDVNNNISGVILALNATSKINLNEMDYAKILINEHHVFLEEDVNFIFRHQYFRDYLSAEYMRAILEKHNYEKAPKPPTVLSDRAFTPNISKMLGECLGEHENTATLTNRTVLHEAINAMRGKPSTQTNYALYNVINIWKEARDNRIIGEDLSKLDFSHVPMNGIRFSENNVKTNFDESIILSNSLLPMGHSGSIHSATFSPDGMFIVTASNDNTAKIWDTDTGECIKTLEGHSNGVLNAVFSSDGRFIVTASTDNMARVWNAKTGVCIKTLEGHNGGVSISAFSSDSKFIVTASNDNTARVWNRKSGVCIRRLEGNGNWYKVVGVSTDGRFIIAALYDNTAEIYDVHTNECVSTLDGHNEKVYCAAFSPDGKRVVTFSLDYTARVWDAYTGEFIKTLKECKNLVESLIFCPDGKYIATSSYHDAVQVIYIDTDECIQLLKEYDNYTSSVAFSTDSEFIVTGSYDSVTRIWDVHSGECIRTLEGHKNRINSLKYSSDGLYIVTASEDNTSQIRYASTGTYLKAFEGHNESVNYATYSPDGKYVVTASYDNTARLWDVDTGKCIQLFKGHNQNVRRATFSPDGKFIVTASFDNTARVWDAKSGVCIRRLEGHEDSVSNAIYSPDGRYIVTVSNDNTLCIWGADTCMRIKLDEKKNNEIYLAAFNLNGMYIVITSPDNIAFILNADTGGFIKELKGHKSSVISATFSPDSNYIVTTSFDKTAQIWDTHTGECNITMDRHKHKVVDADFSPDGKNIASCDDNGVIIIWDAKTGEQINSIQHFSGIHIKGCTFYNAKFGSAALETIVRQHGGVLYHTRLENKQINSSCT